MSAVPRRVSGYFVCLLYLISCTRQPADRIDSNALHRTPDETVNQIFASLAGQPNLGHEAEVADRLEALGPAAIPALERYLGVSDSQEQFLALATLNRLNERRTARDFSKEQVHRYLVLLSDDNVLIRTYAMESLIRAGRHFRPLLTRYRTTAGSAVQQRLDIVLRELQ